jgi:hypothetical protein
VVIDAEGNLGVVVRTEGPNMLRRMLWVEDEGGEEVWRNEPPEHFRLANKDQTRRFYESYKKRKGWEVGRVYKVKDRDYPLLLHEFEFDLVNQAMLYVFRDLNTPEEKFLRTMNEDNVEFVPEWEREATLSAFVKDATSRLDHDLQLSIHRDPTYAAGWSVSGKAFSFESKENAEAEMEKWANQLRIRRVASVLQTAEPGDKSQINMSPEGNLYIAKFEHTCGQPAVFVSRVAAAHALVFLGEEAWKSALKSEIDKYDI